ncbi:alpha/beta fold hydrolase [Promicromonospora sp. NPDC023987]|uniref:alpha/beta hydrolase n=1 Tax=Promicromonospora sp. NPDC023987 TaxID=3155360 RepID=UPI0033CA4E43
MPQAPAAVRGVFEFLGRTAPGPAAALAARAFLRVGRPAPVRTADRPVHEAARRSLVPHKGVDVVTYTWGDPDTPAVLLVHGWQSRASAFGSLITTLTAAGLRVVAYDAPAHGDSGGRIRTALDDVAVVRRLTDVENRPWAGVVGHSLGSLAAGVAVRDGVPTERLAGIASIASFSFTEDVFVRTIGLPWTLRDRFSQAWARQLRDDPEVTPDVADRFDLVARPLPSRVRALWLHDDGDQQISPSQSKLLLEAHPHSGALVTTTGLGHNRILGDADVLAHVVDHLTPPG